jgi:hypothetical protein
VTDSLSHLPINPLPQVPRHVFRAERYVPKKESKREHNQVERTCICGVVKITVLPASGGGWREWRMPGCSDQFSDALGAPECSAGATS